ncbi:hypothetical protein ACJX0J_031864, partial [Zea mays]
MNMRQCVLNHTNPGLYSLILEVKYSVCGYHFAHIILIHVQSLLASALVVKTSKVFSESKN